MTKMFLLSVIIWKLPQYYRAVKFCTRLKEFRSLQDIPYTDKGGIEVTVSKSIGTLSQTAVVTGVLLSKRAA
jgi:hypothetical protein